jgi:probable HAF family extracellular repeat protein
VTGGSQIASGWQHAFLWEKGTMVDLWTLGGDNSWALDINNRRQVVGLSDTASGQHAFLWTR